MLSNIPLSDLPIEHDARFLDNNYRQSDWMYDYTIQFRGCHTLPIYDEEAANRNNENGGSRAISKQQLVRFRVCKKDRCNRSCYGDYITEMREFVNGYTESKMEAEAQKCENVLENCNCQYANDDESCENQCYIDAGLSNCIEVEDQYEEEFEIQRYLECREMEDGNNNNQNNYGESYYIGPYCSSNGKHIHLGVFTDATCSKHAPKGTYEKYNYYGNSLPYSKESIVSHDCISCVKEDENANNNNYNNYYNYEIAEVCERTYENAAKCEKGMKNIVSYPMTADCSFVKKTVYQRDELSSHNGLAIFFAVVFGLSTLAIGGYTYKLMKDPMFNGSWIEVKASISAMILAMKLKMLKKKAPPVEEQTSSYTGFST